MIDRPQLRASAVALLTAEGQLDLVVTYQAVSHLRQVGTTYRIGGVDPAVAGEARVGAVQVNANVRRWRQILAAIDRLGEHRRNVA
jgi:hypothetical protein